MPECMELNAAIAAVRKCLKEIIGSAGETLVLSTAIGDALPGGDDTGLRRLLSCIKNATGFDLDSGNFAGKTFQDIVNKLACLG